MSLLDVVESNQGHVTDLREELGRVRAALDRIAAGTYGACIDCGTDIPLARLHAAPEATRCVACQAATE